MNKKYPLLGLSFLVLTATLNAATLNMGYVAFDVTNPPLAEFDIVNQTGPNSSGDASFPVTTSVAFSDLDLTVHLTNGSTENFSSSSGYFSLAADGLSYDGANIFNTSTTPVASATLTGTFSPVLVSLYTGFGVTISPNFTATITDSTGTLVDGDFAVITATSGVTPPTTSPEPGTWALLAIGFLALAYRRFRKSLSRQVALTRVLTASLLALFSLPLHAATSTAIKLNTVTSPGTGTTGTTQVWITGSGFPGAPSLSATSISLAASCGATAAASTKPTVATNVIGSTYRLEFLIPSSLENETYYVSVNGATTGGAAFASTGGTDCSAIQVKHTNPVLASCNPGSSMSILSYNSGSTKTTPVVAYVPEGAWNGEGKAGIQVVPVEGGGSPAAITTTNLINSCSSNSITGMTVCIDNYTGVYILQGSSITKSLKSGADTYSSFSGGSCENCTIAVNEASGTKGQAVIGIGYSRAASGSALQFLDLASLSFGSPVPLAYEISEDILWDPFRNRVLSPNERNNYDLIDVSGSGTPGPSTATEYGNTISSGGDPDSAGLDCTTNIALSSAEFTGNLVISDLSQVKLTSGSPGAWTAPTQVVNFPEFDSLDAGTDAVAVAPGSTHLGIVNGEFGGNTFGAIQLPSKSGTGTPSFVDYVAATLPSTPDGCGFAAGYDPHTTTAYTSPNNGKAYGVIADWYNGYPDYLAVIDLEALLAAPRSTGSHTVDPTYDLVAHGVVNYVATGGTTGACSAARPAVKALTAKPKPVNKPVAQ